MHSLSESYWSLLEVCLVRLDPSVRTGSGHSSHGDGYLHLLASDCLLRSSAGRLQLPGWLVTRLLSAQLRTSRPSGLLRLYLQYDRVGAAYRLCMDMLSAAVAERTADSTAFGLQVSHPHS